MAADEVWVSPISLYQLIVQGKEPIYQQGSGALIGYAKEIVAEFGTAGAEFDRKDSVGEQVYDPFTGEPLKTAVIYGGVFDLQEQAARKGWTEDEKDLVRSKLDMECQNSPQYVQRRSAPKATAPWPTYNSTHHKQIAGVAIATGTVPEALTYERENKNRDGVVRELEDALHPEPTAA